MSRLALAALLLAGPAARAGYIVTPTGRVEGKVAFADGAVTVDGKAVAWDDALVVAADPTAKALSARSRVRLRTGEVWLVEVRKLDGKTLTVKSELFGEKAVPTDAVAAIDFAAGPAPSRPQAQTLYRAKGEPVAGPLLGATADAVRIDSVLGELTLPRDGLLTYVFTAAAPTPPAGLDEVALVDGTVVRGKVKLTAEGLMVEHPQFGELRNRSKRVSVRQAGMPAPVETRHSGGAGIPACRFWNSF